jgi:hypothetical protein
MNLDMDSSDTDTDRIFDGYLSTKRISDGYKYEYEYTSNIREEYTRFIFI